MTPVPGQGLPRDQLPAQVQTVRAAELERSHATDLAAFLARRLGSVHLNELQGNPFQPDLNFRGFTASPLLGTQQGLSVFLDGVRLNQPFGDVVSWDLVPKSAIAALTLVPGSNPLFGLNTLGGALAIETKDGLSHPGTSLQLLAGAQRRVAAEFETGGAVESAPGLHWFVTGNRFREQGWRSQSPSRVNQLFGKFGSKLGDSSLSLTVAAADNHLNGNGLQEQRLLAADRRSVYTQPDTTRNRAALLNLAGTQRISPALLLSGQVYARRIATATTNGDINDGALGQPVYQPNAVERAALAAAGYSGFPASDENATNTPFPKWRCIAQALLRDEPAVLCNGLINTTHTVQSQHGAAAQFEWKGRLFEAEHRLVAGAALDTSRVRFTQGSALGYLLPDHSVAGVGAFGDGVTGGDVDGAPYDTRVDLAARTRTASVFATDTLTLATGTHLTLAGRYNRTRVTSRDAITPGGGPASLDGEHRFSRFNPALGLTFAAGAATTAYAGLNQGSRAPSAIELGCADPDNPCKLPNALAGDPPLRQVVTTTLEAGLRGRFGTSTGNGNGNGNSNSAGHETTTQWRVGLFHADNRDDILFVADRQSGFGYFRNFGKTRRQGLEAGMTTRQGELTLGANCTFIAATYRSAEVLNGAGNSSNDSAAAGLPGVDGRITVRPGDRLPLIPRHLLKLFAEVPLSAAWSASADINAVGAALARGNENNSHRSDGTYYLGPGRSAGYALLNLGAEGKLTPRLTLFAQLNNALARRTNSAAQLGAAGFDAAGRFVAQPFAANANGDRPLLHSTFFAPGAPRGLWVGLRYSLGR